MEVGVPCLVSISLTYILISNVSHFHWSMLMCTCTRTWFLQFDGLETPSRILNSNHQVYFVRSVFIQSLGCCCCSRWSWSEIMMHSSKDFDNMSRMIRKEVPASPRFDESILDARRWYNFDGSTPSFLLFDVDALLSEISNVDTDTYMGPLGYLIQWHQYIQWAVLVFVAYWCVMLLDFDGLFYAFRESSVVTNETTFER